MDIQKKYDFVVSSYQMGILLTLNDNPKITFKELVEGTKIPMENLRSGLIQLINLTDTKEKTSNILSCSGKKNEKGKLIWKDDTEFNCNEKFTNKTTKIKLALTVKKNQTSDEREVTEKIIREERNMVIQANIIRIMKSRKTLEHKDLINELRQQLSQYFQPPLRLVTEAIGQLIDKDFLKRDEDVSSRYIYVP